MVHITGFWLTLYHHQICLSSRVVAGSGTKFRPRQNHSLRRFFRVW